MARSLTVQHEEDVSTSPLLWGFLLFAVLWLLIGGIVAANASTDVSTMDRVSLE